MSLFFNSSAPAEEQGGHDSGKDAAPGKTETRASLLDSIGMGSWFTDESKDADEGAEDESSAAESDAGSEKSEARSEEQNEGPDSGESLFCPLCAELMHRPVRTTCGHCFCAACLSLWLKNLEDEQRCPECNSRLCSSRGRRTTFAADIDLERRIVAELGAEVYHQRELEHAKITDESLGNKISSYAKKQKKLNKASDVAMAGVGVAAVTSGSYMYLSGVAAGASAWFSTASAGVAAGSVGAVASADGVASAAFWTTALSTEVASGAAVAGAVAGAGVAAFLGGMKLAAWLDDAGRYCILRGGDHEEETVGPSSICVLNLLDSPIRASIFKAKRRRIESTVQAKPSGALAAAESFVSFVARSTGVADENEEKARYDLQPEGEALAEVDIDGRKEEEIRLNESVPKRMMISISLHGTLIDTELGICSTRPGRRIIVCEVTDDAAQAVLQRRRQELIQQKGDPIDMAPPCYWTTDGDPVTFDEIPEAGGEFQHFQNLLDSTFMRDASGRAKSTRDRSGLAPKRLRLTRSFRMQNGSLWQRYRRSCSELLEKRGKAITPVGAVMTMAGFTKEGCASLKLREDLNEVYLFHGTSPQAAMAIKTEGFDMRRAGKVNGQAFGAGMYFAECCTKSDEYAVDNPDDVLWKDHYAILLCRVVLGSIHYTQQFDSYAHNTVRDKDCDSLLGDRAQASGTYREFIVYSAEQVYPEFILIYKREGDC